MAAVVVAQLGADLAGRTTFAVYVHVGRSGGIGLTNSASSPTARPCAAPPAPTSAAVIVPEIVLPSAGQACVPAGPFPRFEHRNTMTFPLFVAFSRWMWAWVRPSEPLKFNVQSISPSRLIDALELANAGRRQRRNLLETGQPFLEVPASVVRHGDGSDSQHADGSRPPQP